MDKGCDITPCSDSTASRSLECRECIRSSGERDPVVWKRGKSTSRDSVDSRELLGTSSVWRRADVIEILDRGATYHLTRFVPFSFVVLLFSYSFTASLVCYWCDDLGPFILVVVDFSLWAPYTCVCRIYSRPTAMHPVQCNWSRTVILLSGDLLPKFKFDK